MESAVLGNCPSLGAVYGTLARSSSDKWNSRDLPERPHIPADATRLIWECCESP